MPSNQSAADFYRGEAARLTSMADSFTYYDVRDQILEIADLYERLASGARRRPMPQPAATRLSEESP